MLHQEEKERRRRARPARRRRRRVKKISKKKTSKKKKSKRIPTRKQVDKIYKKYILTDHTKSDVKKMMLNGNFAGEW